MKTAILKGVTKAAITVAAAVTAGSLAYINHGNPEATISLVALTALLMGFLAFCAGSEE